MNRKSYQGSCHCGAVHIHIARKPACMNDCDCSWCAKSGAIWGYFETSEVEVFGDTKSYTRADYSEPAVQIHFCQTCGCVTHWTLTNDFAQKTGSKDMGSNMRMFGNDAKQDVELRFPDGANWTGKTDYGYRKPSTIWHP